MYIPVSEYPYDTVMDELLDSIQLEEYTLHMYRMKMDDISRDTEILRKRNNDLFDEIREVDVVNRSTEPVVHSTLIADVVLR